MGTPVVWSGGQISYYLLVRGCGVLCATGYPLIRTGPRVRAVLVVWYGVLVVWVLYPIRVVVSVDVEVLVPGGVGFRTIIPYLIYWETYSRVSGAVHRGLRIPSG